MTRRVLGEIPVNHLFGENQRESRIINSSVLPRCLYTELPKDGPDDVKKDCHFNFPGEGKIWHLQAGLAVLVLY